MQSSRSSNTTIPGGQSIKNRHWDKPKEVSTGKNSSTDFLVRVLFRKNTTWQGEIHWLGSDKKRNFRSSLELMFLMQEAMDETETPRANYNFRTWALQTSNEGQNIVNDYLSSGFGDCK